MDSRFRGNDEKSGNDEKTGNDRSWEKKNDKRARETKKNR